MSNYTQQLAALAPDKREALLRKLAGELEREAENARKEAQNKVGRYADQSLERLQGLLAKTNVRDPEYKAINQAHRARLAEETPLPGISVTVSGAQKWENTRLQLTDTLNSLMADSGKGTGLRNAIDRSEARAVQAELSAHLKAKPSNVVPDPVQEVEE